MEILLAYFNKKKICKSAEEAVDFINGLHFRNKENWQKLVVNDRVKELLTDLFNGKWEKEGDGFPFILVEKKSPISYERNVYYTGHQIRTTNCRTTSINMIMPLGETVEEHEAEVERIAEEKRLAFIRREEMLRAKREQELLEVKEGWYSVSLTYERMRMSDMRMIETTFTGKSIAKSGYDAYNKAIADLEKDGEASFNAIYPDALSGDYRYLYLGVKTDDGYTMQPLDL